MTIKDLVKRGIREPLVHFLAAGVLIFAVMPGGVNNADRTIIVTQAQATRLATLWSQTWQRPPRPDELDGLIRDYIKEEIYYREALRLELDEDDAVVRRRLRSKMEYLAISSAENAEPKDSDLQAWLDTNAARYAPDALYSFDQVYAGADAGRATAMLAELRRGADAATSGDAISLPRAVQNAPLSEVSRQFGEGFATALTARNPGDWVGPVESGFGQHLVRIRRVTVPRPPRLADVRQQVENDWRVANRRDREARAYQALLSSYDIRIEKLE